ncbi:MAG: hypothetical protein AABW71_03770 [Nanoarchaeota archaeon]
MNKRGISSIVGVTLMVLGAVIGVAVLWVFINKNIDNARGEVVDPDCLTINLEVVTCRAFGLCSFYAGAGSYEANILISRKVGKGNITGLRFIFEDSLGFQRTLDRSLINVGLSELQSVEFTEPYNSIPVPGEPYLISVAGLLGPKKDVCPIKTKTKTCSIINEPPTFGFIANTTYIPPQFYNHSNKGGYCCQFPANFSECYNGQDPNFPVNPATNLPMNVPSPRVFPYNNVTMCCRDNPYNGQTIFGGSDG